MYRDYFGLNENPFSIAPDPRYLYMSERHREALAHLIYGLQSDGGFVLLTGEVGTGKTTVCRCLLEQRPDTAEVAFVLNPKVTALELLATICDELGIDYPDGASSVKLFVDRINHYLLETFAGGRKTVVIIDEAQNLDPEVLEQIRLLTNLETNQYKLLQIIMLGQPELKEMLARPELRQLAQRITARYHLGPLSRDEVTAYVAHRLSVAGVQRRLFPKKVIKRLYRLSGGIPRLINVLCDRALLGTFVQERNSVTLRVLGDAADEVFGQTRGAGGGRRAAGMWGLALAVLVAGVIALGAARNWQPLMPQMAPQPVALAAPEAGAAVREAPPEVPIAEPELDVLSWPENLPIEQSKILAYQALFDEWGLSYQPSEHGKACDQAQTNGLRCLYKRGSLGSLRSLNRPAVLRLIDGQGREFFATLTRLDDETAEFSLSGQNLQVSVKELELRWFGEYTLLWRVPSDYQRDLQPGSRGSGVSWLNEQMARLNGRSVGSVSSLSGVLLGEVKAFQFSEGLVSDGIVGPQTLIHLNSRLDPAVPTLLDPRKG